MMKIEIFDVGHGGCSLITCPNGIRLMIDCGFRLDPPWFPSVVFRGQPIPLLVFSNLDEDHIKDLRYMWQHVPIGSIFSNPTVSAEALAAMKREHGMAECMRYAHAILQHYGPGLIGGMAEGGTVRAWAYWNRYGLDFTDTNNLSLAVFVRYGSFTILFAGDLEAAGWRALLRVPAFAADLASVNVFVTSHHGRDSGCCDEVFWVCRPDVFVISDEEHRYETQNTTDWYRQRAHGIPDLGGARRYVLSTRSDGPLLIQVAADGHFEITPQYLLHTLWPPVFANFASPAS